MTTARVTSAVGEVLTSITNAHARVSSVCVEVLSQVLVPTSRPSRVPTVRAPHVSGSGLQMPRLYITRGFATGEIVARLNLLACTTTEQIDNNNTLTARVVNDENAATLTQRTPLLLVGCDGTEREYRVRRLVDDPRGAYLDIEGNAPFFELADAGLIRNVTGADVAFTFDARLTAAEWIDNYFTPNLAADGLDWISDTAGVIDDTRALLLSVDRWTRARLVQELATALALEPSLTQSAPGVAYQLSLETERASAEPTFNVSRVRNAVSQTREQADTDLVTVSAPFGIVPDGATESASIAENVWLASIVATGWVALRDPSGGANPIAFDSQCVGCWLEVPLVSSFGYRQILDSRASDGAVQIADTGSVDGALVRVTLYESGTPLTELANPAAVDTYGRVFRTLDVANGRGERNWIPNALFDRGTVGWNAGTGGWIAPYATADTTDLTGRTNGFKAAGGLAALPVDGFQPNVTIPRGTQLQAGGVLLALTNADATITSDGKATVPLATGLLQAVADGDALQLKNDVIYRTVLVDGAQVVGVTTLALKGFVDLAGAVYGARKLTVGDVFDVTLGGTYSAKPSAQLDIIDNTGLSSTRTFTMYLATALGNTNIAPATVSLSIGAAITLRDAAYGYSLAATVSSAYTAGDLSITFDVLVPANANFVFYPLALSTVEAVQGSTETVTVNGSSQEWASDGTLTASFTPALVTARTTGQIGWYTSAGVFQGTLAIVSGAGATATTAVVRWSDRPRVLSGTAVATGGLTAEVLTLDATAVMDDNGAGTLVLRGANSVAIGDNSFITAYRNTYGWPETGGAFLLRVAGSATSDPFLVGIRGTTSQTVWCSVQATLWIPISTNAIGSGTTPIVFDVLDASSGAVLGTVTADADIPNVNVARPLPSTFTAKVKIELAATTRIRVRVSSVAAVAGTPIVGLYLTGVSAFVSPDENVPLVADSHANELWHEAIQSLQAHDVVSPALTVRLLDLSRVIGAQRVAEGVVLGQSVYFRDYAVTQRIVRLALDHMFPEYSDVGFARIERAATALLAGVS